MFVKYVKTLIYAEFSSDRLRLPIIFEKNRALRHDAVVQVTLKSTV